MKKSKIDTGSEIALKKILMVCEAFGGGVFSYVSQLCNDLCDDFEVYLLYALRPQTPPQYQKFLDKRVRLIPAQRLGSKNILNPYADAQAVRELQAVQREVQADIIHLHSSVAGGIGRIAYRHEKAPVVYTPHGYAHILMGPGVKSALYKTAEKILGKTNGVTLTCCASEDEVAKTLCRNTAYIETGLNVENLRDELENVPYPDGKKTRFTVFTLGRICRQKQPQLFNRIAAALPDTRFMWIGDGELRDCLTSPNVEVTGWLPRSQSLALAQSADVFLLCSLGEAIAMSLLESMFLQKLVLVSDVMGNKSVIHDGVNGYVCETAGEYIERIQAAMKEFPVQLPERAYQDVLTIYNTEAMKRKFVAFYNALPEIGTGGGT